MTTYGYARVSTEGQTLDAQIEALKAAGCTTIFHEKIGGAKADRAELAKLLATIGEGDALIVTRLDRLAQSTRNLLSVIDMLDKRGATCRSLGDPWADTTTPHGRLIRTVLVGLAEFERELIRERTGEGRTRAKARGQHMGRPPRLTPHQRAEAVKALRDDTATQSDLARRFAVSQSTISRLAEKAETSPSPAPVRRIDAETECVVRAFMRRIEGKYPAIESLVYGSRARGDHKPDSDADLAIILQGERGNRYQVAGDMAGIAFDVMMELKTDILVSALPLWEEEFREPERFNNPALIANIKREGLRL